MFVVRISSLKKLRRYKCMNGGITHVLMFWCVELPCTFTQFYEFVQYCNSTHQLDLLIRNLLSNSTTYVKEQKKKKKEKNGKRVRMRH